MSERTRRKRLREELSAERDEARKAALEATGDPDVEITERRSGLLVAVHFEEDRPGHYL